MISIVIPLFNEEENVLHLYTRLTEASSSWGEEYELVLVDDGSQDATLPMLRQLSQQDHRLKIIKLSRNFGHQAAISAGLRHAKGDAVAIMDGDLQDPPEQLHLFLDKWREGYHVVYAIRTKRKESLPKRMAYAAFYRLLQMFSEIEIPLDSGDFCVMDRKVVDVLNHEMREQYRFVRGLRAYAGFRQTGLAYERDRRAAGEVKYTFRKLVQLGVDGLLDFSTFPLRAATYMGLFISFISFLTGIFFIVHRILDFKVLGYSPSDTPGLASLAVGIFFLGGLILIVLGIIGEYLGRLYFEVKGRPFYIVEDIYSKSPDTGVAE
jgi:glycosyltransferase involved in cell wall biosynthesis